MTGPSRRSKWTAHTFALGVQWHPEENPDDLRLFAALVAAAEEQRHDVRRDQPGDREGRSRTVAAGHASEADEAIARARQRAFETWRDVAPADRGRLLRRFADAVDADLENLAALEVENAGHTIGNARWEAGNVRDVLHYYSAAPERLFGRQIPVAGGIDITFQEPLGVVGVIVPWNFPMPIAGWGFAPALAAGNTVVLKPAELTPLTAIRLGELALRGGPARRTCSRSCRARGPSSGERFVTHPAVRKVVFTGSTEVGQADHGRLRRPGEAGDARARREERQHRLRRRRSRAGRGASAPYGVFDNAGQDCCARSRILVERSASTTGSWSCSSRRCRAVRVGDPALAHDRDGAADLRGQHRDDGRVLRARRRAGAFRGTRARRAPASGSHRPSSHPSPATTAAIDGGDLRPGGRGGPVRRRGRRDPDRERHASTACPARSGPATSAARCGWRAASRPATCRSTRTRRCATATPFGGFKQSGLGRELGPDALAAFTETKNVFISHGGLNSTDVQGSAPPAGGPGRGRHRRRQRHRPGHRPAARRRGRQGRGRRPSTRPPARPSRPKRSTGCSSTADVTDERPSWTALRDSARRHLRQRRHRVQQRRHLAARRRLDPRHRRSTRGAGCRRST